MDPMVATHRPGPPLASYVESLWYYDGPHTLDPGECSQPCTRERVLPNGRFQIVIDLASGRGAVSGMRSASVVIQPAVIRSVIGVVFRPGGARAFFEEPAGDFFNRAVVLDTVWRSPLTQLCDRLQDAATARGKFQLLEAALRSTLDAVAVNRRALHAAVEYGVRMFRQIPHVRGVMDVSRDAGLSRRRFGQLFRDQVGITPKLYCRLLRFRALVHEIAAGGPVDWADSGR